MNACSQAFNDERRTWRSLPVSACFTISACDAFKEELERIEHLNFLFGEASFVNLIDLRKEHKTD